MHFLSTMAEMALEYRMAAVKIKLKIKQLKEEGAPPNEIKLSLPSSGTHPGCCLVTTMSHASPKTQRWGGRRER